jgi:multiple sugar transport system substrate-binding protein
MGDAAERSDESSLRHRLSRRRFLAGVAGLAGVAAIGGLAAACAGPGATPSARRVTLGSNYSDEVPRQALQQVIGDFTSRTGIGVDVNTVAPGPFQERIGAYLQGTPDDVFSWFGGNRMRFFAERGLASDISDTWADLPAQADAARHASTGHDGRQYFVPFITYPWVIVHRRSAWQQAGYERPQTLAELTDLCRRMRADGLVPFAFGNREGWPAMGTFDIVNMRLNGHDFHIGLLEGRERWTDDRVRAVFEQWRELLEHHQVGAAGRTWQEAARSMLGGEAAMIYLGTFAAEQATEAERDDLAIFPFPLLGTEFDAEMAVDAPINGFMLSRSPADPAAARVLLGHFASPAAQVAYVTANPSRIATATGADESRYTDLQRQMSDVIGGAQRMAQFFDRDTRPDFAGADGMQSLLQDFIQRPDLDLGRYLERVQQLWDSLD